MKEDPASEEKSLNLWEKCLSNATTQAYKHNEATFIFCGNKGNPYGDIIHSMRSSSSRRGRPETQLPYFFNYRYVDTDGDDAEAMHLHTWTVQDESHFDLVPTVVYDGHLVNGRLGYIFCVDISKPSHIKEQFDKWMGFISKAQQLVFEKVGEKKAQELKDAVSRRIQSYEISGVEENLLVEDEKETQELDRENPKVNFGAQITVVLCRPAQLERNSHKQEMANKIFNRLLLYIRVRCLEIGATIFTFANRRQGLNIKQYIDLVVMGQKLTKNPHVDNISLQDLKEEQIFLPAGFDTETILASKQEKHKKSFEELFPTKQKKKTRKRYEYKRELQRDNQHYLGILFFELKKNEKEREQIEEEFEKRGQMRRSVQSGKFITSKMLSDRRKRASFRRTSLTRSRRSLLGRRDFKMQNDKYNTLRLIKGRDRQSSLTKLE